MILLFYFVGQRLACFEFDNLLGCDFNGLSGLRVSTFRAFLFTTEKVPNPTSPSLPLFLSSFSTAEVNASSALAAAAFETAAPSAIAPINSAFVIPFFPFHQCFSMEHYDLATLTAAEPTADHFPRKGTTTGNDPYDQNLELPLT